MGLQIGVMSTVVAGRDDRERFEVARSIGCAGIEVVVLRDDLRGGTRLAALQAARAATGLEIPTLVLDEHNLGGVASADRTVAAAAAEDVRTAIAWAAELGAGAILLPFFVEAELRTGAAFERAALAFAGLCPFAAERGLVLAYEGTLPAARVRALADRAASPAFACYFDTANPVVRALDPPTEIRALGELICRVHVKDVLARKNDCRPGFGRVDFPECAAALGEIGYDGWLVLETPPAPAPLVERDVAFTRSTFAPGPGGPTVFGAFSYEIDEWDALGQRFTELGLGAVQLGEPLLGSCLADRGEAERGQRVLAEHGLRLAGLAGYRNLTHVDPEQRRANVDYIRRCLEVAPSLGTWVVATEAGTLNPAGDWVDDPGNWSNEAWRLLEEALEELVPAAEATGSVLALEGHPHTVLKTQSLLLELFERFPSAHLQLVCDPYNYLTLELLPAEERLTRELLERFEWRFVLAHLKDVRVDGGELKRPGFGQGVFEHGPYLEFLRHRRPDLPWILEHLSLDEVPAAMRLARATGQ